MSHNQCAYCGELGATVLLGHKRVEGTVAGTRHGKPVYAHVLCIDVQEQRNAAARQAERDGLLEKTNAR